MRAFRVAYDGRPFHGFQHQPDVPTVEDALFDALDALGVGGEPPPGYAAAGRTDAGASALAQTVAFECPDWLSPAALNAELPAAVRAWAAGDAPAGFHATHDAAARTYRYHCHAPAADAALARRTLARLTGDHDFHNLTPDDRNTVRALDASLSVDGDFLVFRLTAGGFPRQFVRRLVTLVRGVATGELSRERVERVLSAESLPGHLGLAPAPAYPLVLAAVAYPSVDFEAHPDAAEQLATVFGERRARHRTLARVAGDIAEGAGEAE